MRWQTFSFFDPFLWEASGKDPPAIMSGNDHYVLRFVEGLINCKETTNEQIQFIVRKIANYYSHLLLSDDQKKFMQFAALRM